METYLFQSLPRTKLIWVTHSQSIVAVLHNNIHNKWRWERSCVILQLFGNHSPAQSHASLLDHNSTGHVGAETSSRTWLGSAHTTWCCCCWTTATPGWPTPAPPMTQEPTYWPWVELSFTELLTDRDQTVAEEGNYYWAMETIRLNITHFTSKGADWSPQGFSDVFILWQFRVTETKSRDLNLNPTIFSIELTLRAYGQRNTW